MDRTRTGEGCGRVCGPIADAVYVRTILEEGL